MSFLTTAPSSTETIAVGAVSAPFAMILVGTTPYRLVSTTACWVNRAAGVSAAVAGVQSASAASSVYVPANTFYDFDGVTAGRVSVIQAAASGFASLSPLYWH